MYIIPLIFLSNFENSLLYVLCGVVFYDIIYMGDVL